MYQFRYRIEEVIPPHAHKIPGVVFIRLLEQILIDQQDPMYGAPLANQVPYFRLAIGFFGGAAIITILA